MVCFQNHPFKNHFARKAEFDILISINNFYIIFDIKKNDFVMSENHFLMSQTRISDTKELYFDINKSNY